VDWIALLALLLSAGSLGWQAVDRFNHRSRLVVDSTNGSTSYLKDGELWHAPFLVITAHALHGAIGIRDIQFDLDPKPDPNTLSWGLWALEGRAPTMNLSDDHPALQEGATVSWQYRFYTNGESGLTRATTVTPTIVLITGKRVAVPPVRLGADVKESDSRRVIDLLKAEDLANGPGAPRSPQTIKALLDVFEPGHDDESTGKPAT
jgi:hypothetical protein